MRLGIAAFLWGSRWGGPTSHAINVCEVLSPYCKEAAIPNLDRKIKCYQLK